MLSKSMNTASLSLCSTDMNTGSSLFYAFGGSGGGPTSGVTGGRDTPVYRLVIERPPLRRLGAAAARRLHNRNQELHHDYLLHSKEVIPRRRRGKNNFRPHRCAGRVRLVRNRGAKA